MIPIRLDSSVVSSGPRLFREGKELEWRDHFASLGEFVPVLNGREDFFGVLGRLHIRPNFSYSSIWSNKNGDTVRAHIFAAHKTFLAPNAISLHDPLVFVPLVEVESV